MPRWAGHPWRWCGLSELCAQRNELVVLQWQCRTVSNVYYMYTMYRRIKINMHHLACGRSLVQIYAYICFCLGPCPYLVIQTSYLSAVLLPVKSQEWMYMHGPHHASSIYMYTLHCCTSCIWWILPGSSSLDFLWTSLIKLREAWVLG